MKRIAITGGIGSGKSTVVKFFNELGIPSIDADEIARNVRNLPSVHAEIQQRFGTSDRTELRKILSSDPLAKADLEKITHPLIKAMSDQKIKEMEGSSSAPFSLYEAALLIEAGRTKEFDALIVVLAPDELKIKRIEERDQISTDAAKAMLQAQMSDRDRAKYATHTIENSGDLASLKKSVQKLYSNLI